MFKQTFVGTVFAFVSLSLSAQTFSFASYFPVFETGETWNYTGVSDFSLSVKTVDNGPYSGLTKFGNKQTGIVFSLDSGTVTWHTFNNKPLQSNIVFEKHYQTNKVYVVDDREVVFVSVPEYTVAAGTFKDVIAMAWLNPAIIANKKNVALKISADVTESAVVDIDYYAKGVGLIAYEAVNVYSGNVVGYYGLLSLTREHEHASVSQAYDHAESLSSLYMVSPFKKH